MNPRQTMLQAWMRRYIVLAIVAVGTIAVTLNFWAQNSLLGIVGTLLYLCGNGFALRPAIAQFFQIRNNLIVIFGVGGALYLLGFLSGIFVDFYQLSLTTNALLLCAVSFVAGGAYLRYVRSLADVSPLPELETSWISLPREVIFLIVVLAGLSLVLLVQGRTAEYISSPWDSLPSAYLTVYFLFAFATLLFIIASRRIALALLFLILFSFISHLYLPVVFEAAYGSDRWRHIASEAVLAEGRPLEEAIFGVPSVSTKQFGPLTIPSLFVSSKLSYGSLWGLTVSLSRSTGLSLFTTDKYLIPIVWSLLFPLAFFILGALLTHRTRVALLIGFAPALFYVFQVHGSTTVPVSYGLLSFALLLCTWVAALRYQRRRIGIAFLMTLSFYVNYLLVFIVAVEFGIIAFIIRRWKGFRGRHALVLALAILVFSVMPFILDFAAGFAQLQSTNVFRSFFSWLGSTVGLSYVFGISAAAPLLVQGEGFAFLSSSTVVGLLTLILWIGVIKELLTRKEPDATRTSWVSFGVLLAATYANVFASGYFLSGLKPLGDRMGYMATFFLIPFAIYGLVRLVTSIRIEILRRLAFIVLAVFLAFVSTASYASGPDLAGQVTGFQYDAAKKFAARLSPEQQAHSCILAEPMFLVSLYALTAGRTGLGGFPVGFEYAQPERQELIQAAYQAPTRALMERARSITNKSECYLVLEHAWSSTSARLEAADELTPFLKTSRITVYQYKPSPE